MNPEKTPLGGIESESNTFEMSPRAIERIFKSPEFKKSLLAVVKKSEGESSDQIE